jgi:hypothetical protein
MLWPSAAASLAQRSKPALAASPLAGLAFLRSAAIRASGALSACAWGAQALLQPPSRPPCDPVALLHHGPRCASTSTTLTPLSRPSFTSQRGATPLPGSAVLARTPGLGLACGQDGCRSFRLLQARHFECSQTHHPHLNLPHLTLLGHGC